jgi:DNA-binding response OmpR family regulator
MKSTELKISTVIVVEDDIEIREGLRDFLEDEGYQVKTAANGAQGLELILETKGACFVLLDLQMPVMNGEQLLENLEKVQSLQDVKIPILVLSARAEPFKHTRVLGFIRKPVDLDQLLAHVSRFCS